MIDLALCEPKEAIMKLPRGTLSCTAPEVERLISKEDNHTHDAIEDTYNPEKADIFSLGILLFAIMFGTTPFETNLVENSPLLAYIGSSDLT